MAVQPGLCLTWSETLQTGFLAKRLSKQTRITVHELRVYIWSFIIRTLSGIAEHQAYPFISLKKDATLDIQSCFLNYAIHLKI